MRRLRRLAEVAVISLMLPGEPLHLRLDEIAKGIEHVLTFLLGEQLLSLGILMVHVVGPEVEQLHIAKRKLGSAVVQFHIV